MISHQTSVFCTVEKDRLSVLESYNRSGPTWSYAVAACICVSGWREVNDSSSQQLQTGMVVGHGCLRSLWRGTPVRVTQGYPPIFQAVTQGEVTPSGKG